MDSLSNYLVTCVRLRATAGSGHPEPRYPGGRRYRQVLGFCIYGGAFGAAGRGPINPGSSLLRSVAALLRYVAPEPGRAPPTEVGHPEKTEGGGGVRLDQPGARLCQWRDGRRVSDGRPHAFGGCTSCARTGAGPAY
ncbi:hypothetical protein GCM10011588_60750 [Nocardia jinanensis]|uniref:Uncharacterized protein n=1 Tax=Nocardia jinanensis TaxID=382504 RepID=A0A917VYH5_9NOCA|nr:hypothetical protein GCM10011588_60750 [Nocardia jinanensis]